MGSWVWAAASLCGTGHSDLGDHRQDAFRVLAVDTQVLIAVACDGAGSASHGRYGAAIACRTLSLRAQSFVASQDAAPGPADIQGWTEEARLAIATAAANIGCATSDFATTLVMVVSDGTTTITAHVGDGAVIGRDVARGEWDYLSWPESGEYAATTYFLTDAALRLRIGVTEGIAVDRLALFTDGLERLALDFQNHAAHSPFFDAMFRPLANSAGEGRDGKVSSQLAAFLDSDGVNARTDDDKTLILAAIR